jgi:hypothetical protein
MSIKTTRQRKNRICARQGKHHLFKNRPAEDAVALAIMTLPIAINRELNYNL